MYLILKIIISVAFSLMLMGLATGAIVSGMTLVYHFGMLGLLVVFIFVMTFGFVFLQVDDYFKD